MTKISHNIYAVDGLEILFPGHGVIPYIIEEGHNDLTLIDATLGNYPNWRLM